MSLTKSDFDPAYLLRDSTATRMYAEEHGWDCVTACPYDVWVDLDTPSAITAFDELWKLFLQLWPKAQIVRRTTSKSGNGQHVYVRMTKEYPASIRIGLAASLGSDPKREMLSIMRVLNEDPEPILFFEKKL
jgi:hypothetical protein